MSGSERFNWHGEIGLDEATYPGTQPSNVFLSALLGVVRGVEDVGPLIPSGAICWSTADASLAFLPCVISITGREYAMPSEGPIPFNPRTG